MVSRKKLAESLEYLHRICRKNRTAIRSSELTRTHRERLLACGYIEKVMKGWYIRSHPARIQGDSSGWFSSYWGFCVDYLNHRFGDEWCLSPGQSLMIHAEDWSIPEQLLARSSKGDNTIVSLPFDKSLLIIKTGMSTNSEIELVEGLRVYSPSSAVIAARSEYLDTHKIDASVASGKIKSAAGLVKLMIDSGKVSQSEKVIRLFESVGQPDMAMEIRNILLLSGYTISEAVIPLDKQGESDNLPPYCRRLCLMWEEMRTQVISNFAPHPDTEIDISTYMKSVEEIYTNDAYHSLSIEGYRITRELIEKVQSGEWNPDLDISDRSQRDALATKGYELAFQQVSKSIEQVLKGENSGSVADTDHQNWFREMFRPNVKAGLINQTDLIGYRRNPVYVSGSLHIPPRYSKIPELMETYFDLLTGEESAEARIVLGHFMFVYIHPYIDGNGRMARFLMNLMMASGGYIWTVIPVEQRGDYMSSLEEASTTGNIVPFTDLITRMLNTNPPLP